MDHLPSSLWLHSLQYCTASDLLRLHRCNRHQHRTLTADKTAELLLRRQFHLTKPHLATLNTPASLALQRLLTPLASLERQLNGQPPSPLHRALLIHAVCSSSLTTVQLAHPHSLPAPVDPRCNSTQWVQQGSVWDDTWDDSNTPAVNSSVDLTLASIGLPHMQLWYQRPFWQQGWLQYVNSWTAAATKQADTGTGEHMQLTERDLICARLDSRVRWLGCVQADSTTVRAVGYYYGRLVKRRHWVPATFGRGGYQMELAYSYSSESECQQAMCGGGGGELPIVTFDMNGSLETVNGHHLRLYDSLGVFLLSQATQQGVEPVQQVQQFVQQQQHQQQQVETAQRVSEVGGQERVSGGKCVTAEQLRGLPLYLNCFPISHNILSLWNTAG